MARISVKLNEKVASWAHCEAAECGMTLPRFIAEIVKERREYARAMERFLSTPSMALREPGEPLPAREDL
jgi:hypothetical protein